MKRAAETIYKELVRTKIAVEKRRPDGRGAEEIRPIECEVGVSPRTHGSALFTRGQTQIMTLLTLGTAKEGQRIDDLSLEERAAVHAPLQLPALLGRRDRVHARPEAARHRSRRARPARPRGVIPTAGGLPVHDPARLGDARVERLVVDGLGLRLDPLAHGCRECRSARPVSGIAMGLVKEGDDYVILTDIQGAEDHLGDMDFKVAGTTEGITALQMDIKITGVTQEIMRSALEQAKRAREFILERMAEAIAEPRAELNENAPRISSVKIDPEQIGLVIGKGGETIRALEADYDVQIDIEEDGTVLIYAVDGIKAEAAISAVKALTKEPEVGDEYTGKVVKTTDFGAFVELKKGTDGLLHVSNVGPGRVAHIEDVICSRRRARRGRSGGRQGARPDRAEARGEARGRRPRPAGGARRASEGCAAP